MRLWSVLGTLISAIRLAESLLGKKVAASNGVVLGTVTDVRLDFRLARALLIVRGEGWSQAVPAEQVACLSHEELIFMGPRSV